MAIKMKIGVCDDIPAAVDSLSKIIEGYFRQKGYAAVIQKFVQSKDIFACEKEPDILFLDIEMPDMDGIEVGEELRRRGSECKIIMATGRTERFKEAFKINAFRFISKPFEKEEVEAVLEDALASMIGYGQIELYENRLAYTVSQRDICYVEAYESYVEAMLKNGRRMRKDISLSKIQELLDKRLFYRINRKYLINMDCIERYDGNAIGFGGMEIRIPRVKKKDFEYIYKEFRIRYR